MTTNSTNDKFDSTGGEKPIAEARLTSNVKAGGCAAKMSAIELKQILAGLPKNKDPNLLSGIDNFEDAAVYKLSNNMAIIESVDFFPPVVDDPYLFGQVAANNALSDIYAMGGKPIMAQAIFAFPTCDYPLSIASEILRGGADQVTKAGALLTGGHSIQSTETLYGLAVTGVVHPDDILTNSGARAGDRIVMTKAIGTGVCLLALKAGLLSQVGQGQLFSALTTLNEQTLASARPSFIHACTDVTGFGLIGHIHEMAKASKLAARMQISALRFLPSALDFARQGLVPAGAYGNRKSFEASVSYINDLPLEVSDLLYDPQTAGGLLFAVDQDDVGKLLTSLNDAGIEATEIGRFMDGIPGHIDIVIN
jgi:selenide,water dikinase